ncbi:MAG: hypothetical protein M1818_000679 [Claussenomyces sp. TS43310]|nr:MAG: hypothetical protein M1818_000679 [Claussenomyces sp. TS43310]
MTSTMVDALNRIKTVRANAQTQDQEPEEQRDGIAHGCSLSVPSIGNPISHDQILYIFTDLKSLGLPYSLDALLQGSRIYIPPKPPKSETTPEYKALMARLRREEESRAYERMVNPPPPMETFSQRFPRASAAHAFSSTSAYQPLNISSGDEDDEMTYSDVNRQVMLIINVLISIVACAAALWMAARWWSTPARLALSMSGSLVVAIAEFAVYTGYIRRLSQAKGREGASAEIKEVLKTWVVSGNNGEDDLAHQPESIPAPKDRVGNAGYLRKRKKGRAT